MRLKNKKTGEIIEWSNNTNGVFPDSLAELNAEWEDYEEEPKQHWEILGTGGVIKMPDGETYELQQKEIGNYFETEKEAEKAVEKLKAIKILKDHDLHIEWANTPEYDEDYDEWRCSVDFSVREGCDGDKLFDLLFGGEE